MSYLPRQLPDARNAVADYAVHGDAMRLERELRQPLLEMRNQLAELHARASRVPHVGIDEALRAALEEQVPALVAAVEELRVARDGALGLSRPAPNYGAGICASLAGLFEVQP